MTPISDRTSCLNAPYEAVPSRKDAPRPWSVIHWSGREHGRWRLVARYPSEATALDVADALNRQRNAIDTRF